MPARNFKIRLLFQKARCRKPYKRVASGGCNKLNRAGDTYSTSNTPAASRKLQSCGHTFYNKPCGALKFLQLNIYTRQPMVILEPVWRLAAATAAAAAGGGAADETL